MYMICSRQAVFASSSQAHHNSAAHRNSITNLSCKYTEVYGHRQDFFPGGFRKFTYGLICRGISVGIVTDYRLDGPGSNPGGDKIFCLSRPALGPLDLSWG